MHPAYKILTANAVFFALVPLCFALSITPSLEMSTQEAQARASATEHSDIVIGGKGDRLRIIYLSPVRTDVDLVPQRRGIGYYPSEMLHFTLPPGELQDVTVDLTPTPGWSPFPQQYHLFFASPIGGQDAEIKAMTFLPWSFRSLLRAALRHLAIREVFQVSTFHALSGESVLGFSLAFLLGIAVVIAAVIFSVFRKQGSCALLALTIGCLAYAAWFGVDLARFTTQNLTEWYGQGTYAKAGAVTGVAKTIRVEAAKSATPLFIEVCHDAMNFYPKMLRYFLYPIPVSTELKDIPRATHVVVASKLQWSYDGKTLVCGAIAKPAKEIATFPDGSVLFAVTSQ